MNKPTKDSPHPACNIIYLNRSIVKDQIKEAIKLFSPQHLRDDIHIEFSDSDGVLRNEFGKTLISRVNSLYSILFCLQETLEVKTFSYIAPIILDSIDDLNKSLIKLCKALMEIRRAPLNYGSYELIYKLQDYGTILDIETRADELTEIIEDISGRL